MSSRSRVSILLAVALVTCSFLPARPCAAAEAQERPSFGAASGPAVIHRAPEVRGASTDRNDVVEKLSPSHNCTGNPFFIGPKTTFTQTARPEKNSSPWAQPSTAGHQTATVSKIFEEIKNVLKPIVTYRFPELRGSSTDQTAPTEKISPSQNCTGNPFFGIPNTISNVPNEPVRRAALPPHQTTNASLSSQQPFHNPGKGFVIVLDPGHGGKDPGAVSQDGLIKEKDLTLDIALRLKAKIESSCPDSTVVLTRNKDMFLALEDRTFVANSMKADLFLSIHCNSDPDPDAEGIETYFLSRSDSRKAMLAAVRENEMPLAEMTDFENSLIDLMATSRTTDSIKLATTVHDQVMQTLGRRAVIGRDRGIKAAPLYVLLGAKMPAIMVECGFISNSADKNNLIRPEYRNVIANGLAEGLITYLKSSHEEVGGTLASNLLQRLRGIYAGTTPYLPEGKKHIR